MLRNSAPSMGLRVLRWQQKPVSVGIVYSPIALTRGEEASIQRLLHTLQFNKLPIGRRKIAILRGAKPAPKC